MADPTREVDALIAKTPDWRGAMLATLRRIVREADPQMTEAMKWKRPGNPAGTPVFEHGGIICIAGILKERVRLTFADGASLPDPRKLFNAMLNGRSRAIDFREGDKPNASAIKALVRAGVARRRARIDAGKRRK